MFTTFHAGPGKQNRGRRKNFTKFGIFPSKITLMLGAAFSVKSFVPSDTHLGLVFRQHSPWFFTLPPRAAPALSTRCQVLRLRRKMKWPWNASQAEPAIRPSGAFNRSLLCATEAATKRWFPRRAGRWMDELGMSGLGIEQRPARTTMAG